MKNISYKSLLICTILATSLVGFSQPTITLDSCWAMAEQHYPNLKKRAVLEEINQIEQSNIGKKWLPDFSVMANAAYIYLSNGIDLDINMPTGMTAPTLMRKGEDIYAAALVMNQTIYDGGMIKKSKMLTASKLNIENEQLNIELYQLKQRVSDLFYRIILLEQQIESIEELERTIEAQINEATAALEQGVILPTVLYTLQSHRIKCEQSLTDLRRGKNTFCAVLNQLTAMEITDQHHFALPSSPVDQQLTIQFNRPEIKTLLHKKNYLDAQSSLINAANLPKISGTGSVGGLYFGSSNALAVGMITLNWNIINWNENKNKQKLISLEQQNIDTEIETINRELNIQLLQKREEIKTLEQKLVSDKQLIDLKEKIAAIYLTQLENGEITAVTYVEAVQEKTNTKINFTSKKIALQHAITNYYLIIGDQL